MSSIFLMEREKCRLRQKLLVLEGKWHVVVVKEKWTSLEITGNKKWSVDFISISIKANSCCLGQQKNLEKMMEPELLRELLVIMNILQTTFSKCIRCSVTCIDFAFD